jgi:tetratricopeptide (TPR) repeat protein
MKKITLLLIFLLPMVIHAQSWEKSIIRSKEYSSAGNYQEAIKYAQLSLEQARLEFGENNREYAVSLSFLCSYYEAVGDYKSAETANIEALEKLKSIFGKYHPDYATSLNNLATLYVTIGNYEKAELFLIETNKLRKSVISKNHPDYTQGLNNLAKLYFIEGKTTQAEKLYLEVLEIYNSTLEEDHPNNIQLLKNLAKNYVLMGNYNKAIDYYEESLVLDKKLENEVDIVNTLNNIAIVYNSSKQFEKAIEYYNNVVEIYKKNGDEANTAFFFRKISNAHRYLDQFDKALEYKKAAFEIAKKLGNEDDIADELNDIGFIYYSLSQYNIAIDYYNKALEINQKLDREEIAAANLQNIGAAYSSINENKKTIEYYEKALEIYKKKGDKANIATFLDKISDLYLYLSQYDKALEYAEKALEIARKLERVDNVDENLYHEKEYISTNLVNIGSVYHSWGKYQKAIIYFNEALEIDKKKGEQSDIARDFTKIGTVYDSWSQYNKAMGFYKEALKINQKIGNQARIASDLNNIALDYYYLGQYDKTSEYYKEVFEIINNEEDKDSYGYFFNNIGAFYHHNERYDESIKYYKKALDISKRLEKKDDIQTALNNIGSVYFSWGKYDTAIEYFKESIEKLEEIRLTAKGEIKRDYMSSRITTYQFLISCYIDNNQPYEAFRICELSSAKYLAEKVAEKNEILLEFTDVNDYKNKLANYTSVVKFANMNNSESVRIIVDNSSIYATKVSNSTFVDSVNTKYEKVINTVNDGLRGFKVISPNKKEIDSAQIEGVEHLHDIVNFYRTMLRNPNADREIFEYVSRCLYTFLFQDIEKYITGKKELIILPDGILGFLPFETLIMPDGRYLCEKYIIRYNYSLTVSEIIAGRKYASTRKNLLAIGGAVYKSDTYESDMIKTEYDLLAIQKQYENGRGNSKSSFYQNLGYSSWSNLPGTLAEVNEIATEMKDYTLLTGKQANESEIKSLSKNGKLSNYKILHFATHGIVVQEIPELSAIVLSQETGNTEDGYLRMDEIVNLNIHADFVNLSACETGLGKIYNGEGVVGLTQSFLLAGARGLSVSLWQVDDISTKDFMIALYKKVNNENISYYKAINDVKQNFIQGKFGEKYKSPYFWAPFVYYGE